MDAPVSVDAAPKKFSILPGPGWMFAFGAVASFAAVYVALVSQYQYGMQPCPWCVLQRIIYITIAWICVAGVFWRKPEGRGLTGALVLVLSMCGAASALWQHFVAASSASCNLTLADRIIQGLRLDSMLPGVFEPRASCADAAVSLLGVPYEFWSLALFALLGLVAVVALRWAWANLKKKKEEPASAAAA